jgi:hypothetical protein
VGAAVGGQLGGAVHLDRHPQPAAEQGAEEVAADRGAPHPAHHDRGDAVRGRKARGLQPGLVPGADLAGETADEIQHPPRVARAHRADVVEVDHRAPAAGFSASSISITGMSSRTG